MDDGQGGNRGGRGGPDQYQDVDYLRQGMGQGFDDFMHAPNRYFGGNMPPPPPPGGPSQSSHGGDRDRKARKGKNLRQQATPSQGSGSQNFTQQIGMSQDSYTAFDDFGLTESQSQSQYSQDL